MRKIEKAMHEMKECNESPKKGIAIAISEAKKAKQSKPMIKALDKMKK